MAQFAEQPAPMRLYESYGYPSSNHPNGVNVAFCGGQVDFMAESVDPRVYAQLMTSNAKTVVVLSGHDSRSQAPAAVRLGVLNAAWTGTLRVALSATTSARRA